MNTMTEIDRSVLSDMHKDARGFRPSEAFWRMVDRMTDHQVRDLINGLQLEVDFSAAQEAAAELNCQREFESQIAVTIAAGAGDRATALRWMADAEGVDLSCSQDVEHFFYNAGIAMELWPAYMMEMGYVHKDKIWIPEAG